MRFVRIKYSEHFWFHCDGEFIINICTKLIIIRFIVRFILRQIRIISANFYIFRTLVIPAMLPGIAAAFALVFLNLMKELTATLLLTPNDIKTLSTAVWEYTSDAQYAAATPYAIMLVLFSGIPVFLLKRYGFK